MIATLFFRMGGFFSTESDAFNPSVSEGIKLSLPCVQSAVFFAQDSGGDKEPDESSSLGVFMPRNWGLKFFADVKEASVSSPSSIGCDFAVGRISVTGPLSELKSPVPSIKKKWNVKQPADVKVKGNLPDVDDGEKPLSVCFSVDAGFLFAGFSAVGLKQPVPEKAPFGADSLLVQMGFFPEERNGLRFFTNFAYAASELEESESSKWYSMSVFRPADSRFLMLNDTMLSKSWDALNISLQNSFAAGISRYKSNIEFWNNTLLCLSCGCLNVSLGFWCSDFGFTTLSGSDIRDPLSLYGSLSFAFCAGSAEIEVYASCMTGISYPESFPAEKREETSARAGVSVSCGDFSVAVYGGVKNLCQQDTFSKAVLEASLGIDYSSGSVVWKAETPLVLVKDDGSDFKWEFSVKPPKDFMGGFSGGISGKFCGMEFSAFECEVSYSSGALKISAGADVTAAKKVTWTCSASVKI